MPQDGTAQVLRHLTPQSHPDLLVGTDTLDDAGVFRLSPDLALVQTTDFFPPLVDDAFAFGQIAAANALSDVYAMGGEPVTALNLVGFPDKLLPYELLAEILRGGAERVAAAGGVIVGGHSVRDAEIKYGLAVTGRVHPDRILTNRGARPGDRLVLTKPIGTGVLCSAAKSGRIDAAELQQAIDVMIALNKAGRDAAVAVGVNACTDVTGFGLVGHASEMALASGVTITLRAAQVPLIGATLDLAREGIVTRAAATARRFLGSRFVIDDVEESLADVLADAQTSGGLLLSVTADRCGRLIDRLNDEGALCAVEIGEVGPASDVSIHLRG